MQLHQIVVRPVENGAEVIVLYLDAVGGRHNLTFDGAGIAAVDQIIAECQRRLPPDTENPAKAEIEREIDQLEARLEQLRRAVGAPA